MYLNQEASWTPVVVAAVKNPYGDFEYATAQIIKVRRQEHVEEVRLKDGTVHNTNYIYYTHADVHEDDKLDGNLVVKVYDMRTLSGRLRLRRAITV